MQHDLFLCRINSQISDKRNSVQHEPHFNKSGFGNSKSWKSNSINLEIEKEISYDLPSIVFAGFDDVVCDDGK